MYEHVCRYGHFTCFHHNPNSTNFKLQKNNDIETPRIYSALKPVEKGDLPDLFCKAILAHLISLQKDFNFFCKKCE